MSSLLQPTAQWVLTLLAWLQRARESCCNIHELPLCRHIPPAVLQTYFCRFDWGLIQSDQVCRAGSWAPQCCADIEGTPLSLGCRTLDQLHQCCCCRHMAGKVLQKFLDLHRNQESILHTAFLNDGEGKGKEMRGVCVCLCVRVGRGDGDWYK